MQPDTLIPDPANPQAWNRYAYVHNSPVVYNDPTGHCISILLPGGGAISNLLCTPADIAIELVKPITTQLLGSDANNFPELVLRGMLHFPEVNLTGSALQTLKVDPATRERQRQIIADIRSDPLYGKEAFSDKSRSRQLEVGDHGGMVQSVMSGDQDFWTVKNAELYSTNTKVSADGTITTTWQIRDSFDFEPDWLNDRRQGLNFWQYNIFGTIVGWGLYDTILHGAPYMKVAATWTTTIPPSRKDSPDRR